MKMALSENFNKFSIPMALKITTISKPMTGERSCHMFVHLCLH
jgi:hypothetical protein